MHKLKTDILGLSKRKYVYTSIRILKTEESRIAKYVMILHRLTIVFFLIIGTLHRRINTIQIYASIYHLLHNVGAKLERHGCYGQL